MAAMATVVTQRNDTDNARVWAITGSTVQKPKLLKQFRKEPKTSSAVGETKVQVVYGTEDASGNMLSSKVVFDAVVRYPADCITADVTAALAVFRDVVASDEFTASVSDQNYLK